MTMTEKRSQRARLKRLRGSLTEAEIRGKSEKIAAFLLGTEAFRRARTVMTYVSVGSEVRTDAILGEILNSGRTAAVPLRGDNFRMTARAVGSAADLEPGAYGIPEPKADSPIIEKDNIDLIIVPGLGFDKSGSRMGLGKGYYDRYLKDYRGTSVGLCFDVCAADRIIRGKYDIPVNMVITESGVHFAGQN